MGAVWLLAMPLLDLLLLTPITVLPLAPLGTERESSEDGKVSTFGQNWASSVPWECLHGSF